MNFYKKIFIALLGLIMITPRFANGADEICAEGKYIYKCKFDFPTFPALSAQLSEVEINPKNIFVFWALATYALYNPVGYLCWDFEEPKNNWDNLRKLFNPRDNDTEMNCYTIMTDDWQKLWYNVSVLIQSNTPPQGSFKVQLTKEQYTEAGEWLKQACMVSSVQDHLYDDMPWCQACPGDNAQSKGAYATTGGVYQWTVFSTLADCYKGNDEHNIVTDITGEFYYDNTSTDPTQKSC